MHTIVRYYIRTSMVFLFAGLFLGAYFLVATYWTGSGYPSLWVSAHTHVILIGFVMMMILGVAQWMFPRPLKTDKHYSPERSFFVYYLLTVSTAVRFVCELLAPYVALRLIEHLIVLAALGQLLAFLLFFYNIWTRIRPMGSQIREQKGEKF